MARRVAALSLFPLITLFHLLACTETSGETPSIPQEEPQGDPPYATLVLEATYPDGFSYLSGIRELSDGTVMVADPLAQLLLRLDMDAGSSESLGRVGGAPRIPWRLFDSTGLPRPPTPWRRSGCLNDRHGEWGAGPGFWPPCWSPGMNGRSGVTER